MNKIAIATLQLFTMRGHTTNRTSYVTYIILGFSFAQDIELLDSQRHASHDALQRPHDTVKTGIEKAFELSEILNDPDLLGADAHETATFVSHCGVGS